MMFDSEQHFNRFKINEITPGRVVDGLKRRIVSTPHRAAWQLDRLVNGENQSKLAKYANKHKKERCLIICNGPSLRKTDLTQVSGVTVFGLNRIYLISESLPIPYDYYVAINELVLTQFSTDIQSIPVPKFLNWFNRKLFNSASSDTLYLCPNFHLTDSFSPDVRTAICGGGTVTFVAMQLAYFMGFDEVIIVGMDHSFIEKGIPNRTETRTTDKDLSHFHENYFPKGIKWQLPDLARSEASYAIAKHAFEKAGRRIFDATLDGRCTIFEKVRLQDLF